MDVTRLTALPARCCRQEDAARKRHSTVGEALGIASQMTAALAVPPGCGGVADEGLLGTVLTHFSQRYPTVPPEQEGGGGRGRVLFAFDGMCIPLDPPKLEGEMPMPMPCPLAKSASTAILLTRACESAAEAGPAFPSHGCSG